MTVSGRKISQKHLEAVDYHHNHTAGSRKRPVFANGYVYVEVHIQVGPPGFLFDTWLYLREKWARQLHRERGWGERLHYRSKYALAREMLVERSNLLLKGYQTYVFFDSWYASARVIKSCWRQRWHVICALKSKRRIDKKRIDHHNQLLKHRRYQTVKLKTADSSRKARTYLLRSVKGHLEEVAGEVCVIISKKHLGDMHPKYFDCTDLKLSDH